MRKSLLWVGLLALVGTAGAQNFVWPQGWTTARPEEVRRGGTLRAAVISDYRTFNPFITAEAGNVPSILAGPLGLVRRDPTTGDWIPYMAESWTISPDRLQITFRIRRGMRWSDGRPITADDWIMTWRIHTDKDVGSNSYDSFFLDGRPITLTKIDDFTIRFNYPRTDAEAFSVASFEPWPAHIFGPVYQREGAEGIKRMWTLAERPENIVSGGPWLIESYRPGERIVFRRNPTFGEWNRDAAGNPLPYLDRYEIRIVGDVNAALAEFLAGNIDVFNPTTVDHISQIRRAIEERRLDATIKVNASPIASSQFMVFNWNKASDPFKQSLFRSDKFRRAMSHLVNRQAVVELVYGGLGTPMFTSVYPVLTQWVNPRAPRFDHNPQQAQRLLAELGFTRRDREGFLIDAQGRRLEFNLATNAGNVQREQIARLFVDEARRVGVRVNFAAIDFNVLVGQLLSTGPDRPFDAIIIGLTGGGLDWPFGANVVPCNGNLHMWNRSGQCLDPRETLMDALYSRGRAELDFQRRRQIGFQMQEIEAQLLPMIQIAGPNFHTAWNNRVGGQHPDPLISSIWGARQLELTFARR
ncbi:ABC transporter substrate-binding protein [Thermus thermamylovorans]|uniref:ABC transporter substrate-binding protein n=1 Tax=Thermus thermamylovorans TaxID=2509362 RepID=A0A4Q9B502_9DEIN|nr:ABC transporter substrate-binding protein [Thermus thermamylovorans]TBH20203.1 ABC transporter substrate-binding protein [Thermus thermamylovorans]